MTAPSQPTSHQHDDLAPPAGFHDPAGRPVDHHLLGQLMGAAFDGCVTCQDPLLTLLCEDSVSTARLVELACVATQMMFGGLPPNMVDESVPGMPSREFRRLASLGADSDDEAHTAMFDACTAMTTTERRSAANTAVDLLVGHLAMP